jgi:hypothetical protein
MRADDPDTYLTELYRTDVEQAHLLNVTTHTLWRWRGDGYGPPWLRIGSKIYYRKESTVAWIAAQEQPSGTGRAA